jgi:hypothetical protein
MDKLCLIKPWKLRAVRLRIDQERDEPATEIRQVPCSGPIGEQPDTSFERWGNGRFSPIFRAPDIKPSIAPVSDVIFASVNNTIDR